MSLSAAQLIASAEVCGEALRRLRVARDLTQAKRLKPVPRRARFGLGLHALRRSSPHSRRARSMNCLRRGIPMRSSGY
jgi:hypothetical protein